MAKKKVAPKMSKKFTSEMLAKYLDTLKNSSNIMYQDGIDDPGGIVCPTGLYTYDYISGIGGIVTGKIVHIYGMPSTLKSHIGYWFAGALLRSPELAELLPEVKCCVCDWENSWDPKWHPLATGIDPTKVIRISSYSAEDGLNVIIDNITSGLIPINIIDSVTAMLPAADLSKDMHGQTIGTHARLLSKMLAKVASPLSVNNHCILIAINQVRHKITNNPYTSGALSATGGISLSFYSSIEIMMSKAGSSLLREHPLAKSGAIDQLFVMTIKKNKTAPVFKDPVQIAYNSKTGIHRGFDIYNAAALMGIVTRAGSYVKVNGQNVWNGAAGYIDVLDKYLRGAELPEKDAQAAKLLVDAVEQELASMRDSYRRLCDEGTTDGKGDEGRSDDLPPEEST